jgi:hypothetical protein
MLSSVLRSERAVNVNIEIIRAFGKGLSFSLSTPNYLAAVLEAREYSRKHEQ